MGNWFMARRAKKNKKKKNNVGENTQSVRRPQKTGGKRKEQERQKQKMT